MSKKRIDILLTEKNFFDGVTSIKDDEFTRCDDLEEIVFPNCLISIGNWSFSDCLNLKKVTLP